MQPDYWRRTRWGGLYAKRHFRSHSVRPPVLARWYGRAQRAHHISMCNARHSTPPFGPCKVRKTGKNPDAGEVQEHGREAANAPDVLKYVQSTGC